MPIEIRKDSRYAESSVTFVGVTHNIYGRPQYVLVDADEGKNPKLKFPGLRFRAPLCGRTLEDVAVDRFEEQTGLRVIDSLGLRAIIPTRGRHDSNWIFRNVFAGIVDGTKSGQGDGRKVYVADPGAGGGIAYTLGNSSNMVGIDWVVQDNEIVARIATDILTHFDWTRNETEWFKRIPYIKVPYKTKTDYRPLGCGLAVSSMMLIYRASVGEAEKIILLKRKQDKYPGYAGGKIESPTSTRSENLDPISCCVKEGQEEYGFKIQPLALIGCACTPTDIPSGHEDEYHNSIVTYSFVARPTNLLQVQEALENPGRFLEGNMENYVVETLSQHRDRIMRGELRMPDMVPIGDYFFGTFPRDRISLVQFIDSGII